MINSNKCVYNHIHFGNIIFKNKIQLTNINSIVLRLNKNKNINSIIIRKVKKKNWSIYLIFKCDGNCSKGNINKETENILKSIVDYIPLADIKSYDFIGGEMLIK